MPPLPRLQRAVRRGPPFDAVPLPRLRQALFRAHRQRDGRHQARLPRPGHRPVPADHRPQGRLRHEAAPRPRHQPEVGLCTWRTAFARAGRGPVGKTPVAGARDRATNEVAARPLPGTTEGDLQGFVRGRVAPGAQVRFDEAAACAGMAEFAHEGVKHSGDEYVRGTARTNGIESFRSLFKRGLYGTYHRISVQHSGRYLTEFAGRRNARNCDTAERMRRMARGPVGRTLTYRQLVGKAAVAARARPSRSAAASLHTRCEGRSGSGIPPRDRCPARIIHRCSRPGRGASPRQSGFDRGVRGGLSSPCVARSACRRHSDTNRPFGAHLGRTRKIRARRRLPQSEQF